MNKDMADTDQTIYLVDTGCGLDPETITYNAATEQGSAFTTYEDATDRVEEYLNELWAPATVCGFEYQAGTALKAIDPIAFRCLVSDLVGEFHRSEFLPED